MAKNNNDNNDENKQNDALENVAENLKNAINELISKHTDADGTPVDVEVTVEKDSPQKEKPEGEISAKKDETEKNEKDTPAGKEETSKKPSKKGGRQTDDPASSIITVEQMLPLKLPLVVLNGHPIFPGIFTPLMLSTPDDVKIVED